MVDRRRGYHIKAICMYVQSRKVRFTVRKMEISVQIDNLHMAYKTRKAREVCSTTFRHPASESQRVYIDEGVD